MSIVYLYGAGGHAKVIVDILKEFDIEIPIIFDDTAVVNSTLLGIPIQRLSTALEPMIISIGDNKIREKIVAKLADKVTYECAISKSATISDRVDIGEGTVVAQGAIIQSSTQIGKHVIINTGASIDHDNTIGNFVHIAPRCVLCGGVSVGEGTLMGAGSIAIPGVKIGKWSIIGAGSVVVSDIPDNVVAVGNPCKVIKKSKILEL